jgi:hypothetical protein
VKLVSFGEAFFVLLAERGVVDGSVLKIYLDNTVEAAAKQYHPRCHTAAEEQSLEGVSGGYR